MIRHRLVGDKVLGYRLLSPAAYPRASPDGRALTPVRLDLLMKRAAGGCDDLVQSLDPFCMVLPIARLTPDEAASSEW